MTPEQQRIAIATACGWANTIYLKPGDGYYGQHPILGTTEPLPDYLNDLNAMHETEKILNEDQRWTMLELLGKNGPKFTFCCAFATAAQRAEAFLRCLNLWQE